MSDAAAMAERIRVVFNTIAQSRMAGLPFLNPALGVEVVGLQVWQDQWFCVLVTPWFMNLLVLPQADDGASAARVSGETIHLAFPAGRFAFLTGHEEGLGPYLSCSLFSPVFEFSSHDQAVEVARAIVSEVLAPAIEPPEVPKATAPKPSRRALLALNRTEAAAHE